MSYLEGIGCTDRTVDFWTPSKIPRTKLSSEKSLLSCLGHCGFFASMISPDSFGADHLPGLTWTPQPLTLHLPITQRWRSPWCSVSSCSHLVPSRKLSPRLTMNSLPTALHMCLQSRSPGRKELFLQESTWLLMKQWEKPREVVDSHPCKGPRPGCSSLG